MPPPARALLVSFWTKKILTTNVRVAKPNRVKIPKQSRAAYASRVAWFEPTTCDRGVAHNLESIIGTSTAGWLLQVPRRTTIRTVRRLHVPSVAAEGGRWRLGGRQSAQTGLPSLHLLHSRRAARPDAGSTLIYSFTLAESTLALQTVPAQNGRPRFRALARPEP